MRIIDQDDNDEITHNENDQKCLSWLLSHPPHEHVIINSTMIVNHDDDHVVIDMRIINQDGNDEVIHDENDKSVFLDSCLTLLMIM